MRTFAVMLVMLCACVKPGGKYVPFTPAQAVAKPDSFARAKRVLIERGLEIQTADQEAGIISTSWEEDKFLDDKRRFRWNITIDGEFITVTSQCQTNIETGLYVEHGQYEDCGERQPERRSTEAQAIADAIAQ